MVFHVTHAGIHLMACQDKTVPVLAKIIKMMPHIAWQSALPYGKTTQAFVTHLLYRKKIFNNCLSDPICGIRLSFSKEIFFLMLCMASLNSKATCKLLSDQIGLCHIKIMLKLQICMALRNIT